VSGTLVPADGNRAAYDPLDLQLGRAGSPARRWPARHQSTLLVLVGAALGPHGVALLTPATIAVLDPAIPVALAAVGVLVAFELGPLPLALLGLATAEGVMGAVAVGVAVTVALPLVDLGMTPALPLAVIAAVCAATSSTIAGVDADAHAARPSRARIADLDAVVPIALGGLALSAIHEATAGGAVVLLVQSAGISALVAAIGWLLLSAAGTDAEQRVYAAATLLLLGGAADSLRVSPLLAGFLAGLCCRAIGGQARAALHRDLARVHHPLLAVILVVAGALAELSVAAVVITIVYVLVRAVGKLAASRMIPSLAPAGVTPTAQELLYPGTLPIAFALASLRVLGPELIVAVTVAVLGTLASYLIAGRSIPEAAR
jgi:hypothetical protein